MQVAYKQIAKAIKVNNLNPERDSMFKLLPLLSKSQRIILIEAMGKIDVTPSHFIGPFFRIVYDVEI